MTKTTANKLFKNVASIYTHATIVGNQIGYQMSEEECREALQKFAALGFKAQAMSRATWEKLNKA